jgi:hypothetical protein
VQEYRAADAEQPAGEVFDVQISHVLLHTPYIVRVRRYYPLPSDRTHEQWPVRDETTGAVTWALHECPRFAIADMQETATMISAFLRDSVEEYVEGFIGHLGELLISTYREAIRYSKESEVRSHHCHIVTVSSSCIGRMNIVC